MNFALTSAAYRKLQRYLCDEAESLQKSFTSIRLRRCSSPTLDFMASNTNHLERFATLRKCIVIPLECVFQPFDPPHFPLSPELCFTHKSQNAVGAKHLGDSKKTKTKVFLPKYFALPRDRFAASAPCYASANALPRDRMMSQVEGEAFAKKYPGASDKIKRECFAPTEFQEIWVKHRSPEEARSLQTPPTLR